MTVYRIKEIKRKQDTIKINKTDVENKENSQNRHGLRRELVKKKIDMKKLPRIQHREGIANMEKKKKKIKRIK